MAQWGLYLYVVFGQVDQTCSLCCCDGDSVRRGIPHMTLPVSDAPSVSSSLSLLIYIFTRPGRLPLTMYNSAPHGRSLRSFFFYRSVKDHTKTFLKETSSYLLFTYQLLLLTACFVSSVNQFPGTLLSDPPPFTLRIIIVQPDQRLLLHSTMFKTCPCNEARPTSATPWGREGTTPKNCTFPTQASP